MEVTADDVKEQKQRWLADIRWSSRQEVARMLEPVEGPPTMPAYFALVVDAVGNVWVQNHRRYPGEPASWTAFDPDGVVLGSVGTPSRFVVHRIGGDYILGRWRDEFDVEQVLMYELIKP